RRGLDGARRAHLSRLRLAQPGGGEGLGVYPVDPHDAPAPERADVPADARGAGPGDAGTGAVAFASLSEWHGRWSLPIAATAPLASACAGSAGFLWRRCRRSAGVVRPE